MPGTKRSAPEGDEKFVEKRRRLQAVDSDFVPPPDWPKDGPINLDTDDLPHASADTEWWYVNGHCENKEGRKFSYFASFFRIVRETFDNGDVSHVHALNWGIVDVETGRYLYDPLVDTDAPKFLERQLKEGKYDVDPMMRKAFLEVVQKGNIPRPDRRMQVEAKCKLDKLDIDMDGNLFKKLDNGNYYVKCQNEEKGIAIELELEPKKKPTRQGHNGFVKIGRKQDTMMYYFIPRNVATGTVTIDKEEHKVEGTGWYDHEFGGHINADKHEGYMAPSAEEQEVKDQEKDEYAWNWVSVQFENGMDLTATNLVDPKDGFVFDNFVITVEEDSTRTEYDDLELKALNMYASPRTTLDYPTKWSLKSEKGQLDLYLEAEFDNQEFLTLISKPGFWEGRMKVSGTWKGEDIKGLGFVERHGHQTIDKLGSFFKRVSLQVQTVIDDVLPKIPNRKTSLELICNEKNEHLLKGADDEAYFKEIVHPIREYVMRGGKAWRSYAFMMTLEAVGGSCEGYKLWLAMPEIMHVGSLIVDDVQDKSETRRGGLACHHLYGMPTALNAGTTAYFLAVHLIDVRSPHLTQDQRLALYETYFLALRAGHAGQAFDIQGLDYMMDEIIESGDGKALEKRVICTHRLKSGVPAACLTRMASTMGNAPQEIADRISDYFERVGTAFQIMDDVLNLRGIPGKIKAEDLMVGKVTYPVAKAMTILDKKEDRRDLWDRIAAKPQDPAVLQTLVDRLEDMGAIDASSADAAEMVEAAWKDLDPVLPDSFYKMMMRAFGHFVLAQHY